MSKTIFVIGANSALAKDAIRALGVENKVITGGRKGCEVVCDITQPITIPDNVDVVLNFAAAFGGTDDNAVLDVVQTNEISMLRICMAAHAAGVAHVVNISSMSAVHEPGTPYYSIYAITKRHGDELMRYYCGQNDLALTILRPSQLYGDDEALAKHQPFFYQMIDKAAQGENIVIYGNHDALRNYLHVSDLSELINRVVARSIEGVYPCLGPTNTTYGEIARTAQSVFGKGGSIVFLEDKPDTSDNIFDMDLSIYEKTDFQPRVTLEAGIQSIRKYRGGEQL